MKFLRPDEVCNLHETPIQMPNWTAYKNAMATIATLLHKELNSVISQLQKGSGRDWCIFVDIGVQF